MERQVGNCTISVTRGDITQARVDAIVNAANAHLWMGGGVAGAIKRAGGEEIEREAMRQGPIPAGEAVVTGAGRLPCRYVIHAATMGQDLATSDELIRRATRSSLQRAVERRFGTVAFPALGTGVGGFPPSEAARIMIDEVAAHARAATLPTAVILVGYDAEASRAFEAALLTLNDVEG